MCVCVASGITCVGGSRETERDTEGESGAFVWFFILLLFVVVTGQNLCVCVCVTIIPEKIIYRNNNN